MRRRNHIAKDLQSPKYHQRRKEGKKPEIDDHDWEDEVEEYYHKKDK